MQRLIGTVFTHWDGILIYLYSRLASAEWSVTLGTIFRNRIAWRSEYAKMAIGAAVHVVHKLKWEFLLHNVCRWFYVTINAASTKTSPIANTRAVSIFRFLIDISAKWAAERDGGQKEIFFAYWHQDNLIQIVFFYFFHCRQKKNWNHRIENLVEWKRYSFQSDKVLCVCAMLMAVWTIPWINGLNDKL